MQQYFTDKTLAINDLVFLDEEILYHLEKVLRKGDDSRFRLVDGKKQVFLCSLKNRQALVLEKLEENRESKINVTAIVSLIKNDHFELCLQKLTELGVSRIVPYEAERSVVKGLKEAKLKRFQKIVQEASEQCLRTKIPEVTSLAKLKDLSRYLSQINLLPYEKEDPNNRINWQDCKDLTYIIGPEGGFTLKEVEILKEMGFVSVSLGPRILRAETAAIYMAVISSGGM